jgi:hypothetical protein
MKQKHPAKSSPAQLGPGGHKDVSNHIWALYDAMEIRMFCYAAITDTLFLWIHEQAMLDNQKADAGDL